MPLDTLAREVVEVGCGSSQPKLTIAGERRRYVASELLFGWLVDPASWEEIEFLPAEHELLRELLEVPPRDVTGNRLRHVSPAQVERSAAFWQSVQLLSQQENVHSPTEAGRGRDAKVRRLYKAYATYREITFDKMADARVKQAFTRACGRIDIAWLNLIEQVQSSSELDADARFQGQLLRAGHQVRQLVASCSDAGRLSDWDDAIVACRACVADLLDVQTGDEGSTDLALVSAWRELLAQVDLAREVLYDNEKLLRVVPALNVAALSRNRLPENEAQPWLDLQTVLQAPREVLAAYPQAELQRVAGAFERAGACWRREAKMSAPLSGELQGLAAALRDLAVALEPVRQQWGGAEQDAELLSYTSYPAPEALRSELRYNRIAPFRWSWPLYLAAWIVGIVAHRLARHVALGVSVLILAVALGWSIYGFALRMSITGWAPVTNMYETVIFLPLIVGSMGLVMFAWPLLKPGAAEAWQRTCWPTWWIRPDGPKASTDCEQVERRAIWNTLLALPRAVLTWLLWNALFSAPTGTTAQGLVPLWPDSATWTWGSFANEGLAWGVGVVLALWCVWYVPRLMLSSLLAPAMVWQQVKRSPSSPWSCLAEQRVYVSAAAGAAALAAFVAWHAPVLDRSFTPLQPILRDNFWLTVHVLTIVSSYAAGALAWGIGNVALGYYLCGRYGERGEPETCSALASAIYKSIQVAVVLLATGTILGGLWADLAWGRFWGWDPKEVWALITLLVYLAILHGRYAGWVGHFGIAAGGVLGATAIVMSWYGVNFVLGVGLHSYGFGSGGQAEVFGAVALNWVWLSAAAWRCWKCKKTVRQARNAPAVVLVPKPAFAQGKTRAVERVTEENW